MLRFAVYMSCVPLFCGVSNMWKVIGRTVQRNDSSRLLAQLSCVECTLNRNVPNSQVPRPANRNLIAVQQARCMSNQRKGFFEAFFENIKEGLSKDKTVNENLKKFREEKKKLEESEAIKQARKKFDEIRKEEVDTPSTIKKGLEDVKEKVSETLDEVQKKEFVKKSLEYGQEIGKTASKAGETIYEQSKKIGSSKPVQSVSEGVKAVKKEYDDVALSQAQPYKSPEVLRMRSAKLDPSERHTKIYEPDNETVGIELHKDAKWFKQWQDFKENNQYLNKMFDLKMKYDESDNPMVRASRMVTDKVQYVFGGMFSKTEMSEVMTEIVKIDPDFDQEKFLKWCRKIVIPNVLEAMIRGEEEVLKDWCYEAPFNVLMQPFKQAQATGLKIHTKVMDISNLDIMAGKMVEQGPVLVISFISQQTHCVRNMKGDLVEGDPEKVLRVTYVWALCRDQNELDPEAAWKLMDLSANVSEQWL